MLVLHGFAGSNYYNKVKLALLEKSVEFDEAFTTFGERDEDILNATPLGKVPFIRTDRGALCESSVILDYLEAAYPTPPLMPSDPWEAAKVRELGIFLDMHLELVARQLYPKAFFGAELSDADTARIARQLTKNIAGFRRLAKFAPYVAGSAFTLADCAAWVHLPVISMATRAIYGDDLLAAGGIDWKPYAKLIGERPSAQRVTADRKAEQAREAGTASG